MTTINVALGARSYPVRIENGLLAHAGAAVAEVARNRRIAVVGDEAVARHVDTLLASLAAAGFEGTAILLPGGEAAKSWTTLEVLVDSLLGFGVARGDHVVAVGGGTIGDLAGFACAIVKRGVGVIQVPTTLLAQVDSSVGGKTGINTRRGKNLVGAFHQPSLVLIDPAVLTTLPPRELRAGYAEIVKYGLIDDADFFAWCEANGATLIGANAARPDPVALSEVEGHGRASASTSLSTNGTGLGITDLREHAIRHAVAAKARIVAADEHETTGQRALLNLGHTFGHALEAEAGYDGSLLHGEAVAAGMALAFAFSAERGLCPPENAARVAAHLRSVGLPASVRETGIKADGATLVEHMRHDKKASGGNVPFLLARGIGQTYLDATVDLAEVAAFLDRS
ncbi:MAG: 3-dehydroquinate synthase [Pseudomonadota bacterium]